MQPILELKQIELGAVLRKVHVGLLVWTEHTSGSVDAWAAVAVYLRASPLADLLVSLEPEVWEEL